MSNREPAVQQHLIIKVKYYDPIIDLIEKMQNEGMLPNIIYAQPNNQYLIVYKLPDVVVVNNQLISIYFKYYFGKVNKKWIFIDLLAKSNIEVDDETLVVYTKNDAVINFDLLHHHSYQNARLIMKKHILNCWHDPKNAYFDQISTNSTTNSNEKWGGFASLNINYIKHEKSTPFLGNYLDNVAPTGHQASPDTASFSSILYCQKNQLSGNYPYELPCFSSDNNRLNQISVAPKGHQAKPDNLDISNTNCCEINESSGNDQVINFQYNSRNEVPVQTKSATIINYDLLTKHCMLFKLSLTNKLNFVNYFHLLTNLNHDDELFKIIKNKYKIFNSNKLSTTKFIHYKSTYCYNYCPYFSSCHNNINYKIHDHINKQLSDQYCQTKVQMRSEKSAIITSIFAHPDNKIHLMISPTGSGKTHDILTSACHQKHEYITYATPTHKLKNQIVERLGPNIDVTETPELPDNSDRDIIEFFMAIGDYESAVDILSQTNEGREYIKEAKKIINGFTITTSLKALLNIDNDYNLFTVFDEDIFDVIFNPSTVNLDEVKHYFNWLKDKTLKIHIKMRLDKLNKNGCAKYEKPISQDIMRRFMKSFKEYLKEGNFVTTSVLKFLICKSMFRVLDHSKHDKDNPDAIKTNSVVCYTDISHLLLKIISKGKTIIILSATIDRDRYIKLFGDKIVIHEIKSSPIVATIEQINTTTMSYSDVKNNSEKVQSNDTEILNAVKRGVPVITFKEDKKKFEMTDKDAHLGHCSGFDQYKDVPEGIVRGKLTAPAHHIAAVAWLLDPKLTAKQILEYMDKRKSFGPDDQLFYNGKRFLKYYSYVNDLFRKIDMHFSWSVLTQAVGRFRPLTNTCHIKIYNDFIM